MNTLDRALPIGVFDSGLGGLTVVRALMERLPHENILYFGDTAHLPYGGKSVETIRILTQQNVAFLLSRGVKMLVVACNTMAAVAGDVARACAKGVPVLDVVEAGAEAAVKQSRGGTIGVIATSTTVNANVYAQRIHALNESVRVYSQACPLLVPLVEEGWLDHPVTRMVAQEYLKPVLAEEVDTLILGCTHYPLLKPLLRELTGPDVCLVDAATTTAEMVAQRLAELNLTSPQTLQPQYHYVVSDVPLRFQTIGERFLGRSLGSVEKHIW